jgi:hypothetical protein
MKKPSPRYHVTIEVDDKELLYSEVIATYQPIDQIRYYSVIEKGRYGSINDALHSAEQTILDFIGREWL